MAAHLATVLAALGGAASGYVLRREAGAVWLAPFAFGSLLAFSNGSLLIVELVLGIFAVYATLMVVAEPQRAWKGWYFVAARVLTAGLALVLSYDITASATVVSVTFALVLAAQHGVRWAMRARLAEVPYQQAAVWITLAGRPSCLSCMWRGKGPPGCRHRMTTAAAGWCCSSCSCSLSPQPWPANCSLPGFPLLCCVRGTVRRSRAGTAGHFRRDVPRLRGAEPHRDRCGAAVRSVARRCGRNPSAQAERGRWR